MATLSSGFDHKCTSGVDGSSQITIEKIEGSFDIKDFLSRAVLTNKIVGVE
jgi:hypothetical protein